MFSCRWTTLAGVVLLGVVSACRPSGYALLQPQHHEQYYQATSVAPLHARDTIPQSPKNAPTLTTISAELRQPPGTSAPLEKLTIRPKRAHLQNPDASALKPKNAWLTKSGLLEPTVTTYVYEPPMIQTTKRRTPILAHGAFAGGLLSYVTSALSITGGWMWVIVTTLPLLTALVGVMGLTKINRNREQYRGKGWAISAILLGTGVLGMIWVALFALASSKAFWG